MRFIVSICAALCLLCGIATAQTLELDEDVQIQGEDVVYTPVPREKIDPFDRKVHIGLFYSWSEKSIFDEDDDASDFSSFGVTLHGYGERFLGGGIAFSYLTEEKFSESNFIVANDMLESKVFMYSVDFMASLRFPIYFLDIYANAGLTIASLNLEQRYFVNNNKIIIDKGKETALGAFVEVGGRAYIASGFDINLTARYSSLNVTMDNVAGNNDLDMGGFSVMLGLGYAFY